MSTYPKYLMYTFDDNNKQTMQYLSLHTAAVLYVGSIARVSVGNSVLLDDTGKVRPITAEDIALIQRTADEYSAHK
jgi:beta-N-acetylglucosaminidase